MNSTLFEYSAYKTYLRDLIENQPKKGRGIRLKLAQAVGCQQTYISQILNGHVDLNLEQAGKVNRFFGHSKEESHFFMLLVQWARSGDQETRKYFQEQIDSERTQRLMIKNRLGLAPGLSYSDQVTYYSAWYYSAVHILLTLPDFRTKQTISSQLGLSISKTNEILDFLVSTGLADQRGDQYFTGQAQIHLGNDSKLIVRHHTNWRLRAMHSLDQEKKEDLHYSGVFSLAASDVTKIKSMVVRYVEEIVSVVKTSKEEKLAAFCVDFFGL